MSRISDLAASLKWLPGDLSVIKDNRAKIATTLAEIEAEREAARALMAANRSLCKHPSKTSYYDPRDGGGWDCPDCGDSR